MKFTIKKPVPKEEAKIEFSLQISDYGNLLLFANDKNIVIIQKEDGRIDTSYSYSVENGLCNAGNIKLDDFYDK